MGAEMPVTEPGAAWLSSPSCRAGGSPGAGGGRGPSVEQCGHVGLPLSLGCFHFLQREYI